MHQRSEQERQQFRARIQAHVKKLFNIDDTSGIELIGTIQHMAQLSEMLDCLPVDGIDISGPRFRLMLRLLIDEEMGNTEGLTPTSLSHFQRVTRNTISSLLRGLEDQGLIQRALDPKDLRVFHIQLTPLGRDLMLKSAPKRIAGFNQMLSGLSQAEREQLTGLLGKLQNALIDQVHNCEQDKIST